MNKRGHFIVIEGLEGAGKSSVLKIVEDYLKDKVPKLITTREPGGTEIGEMVRTVIKSTSGEPLDDRAELLLFYAARVQLLERVILPALAEGCWVLADRFELSTFAYQGAGRGLELSMIENLSSFCLKDFSIDLTLFLDITPEIGFQRVHQRGPTDRIEQESIDFFKRVAEGYQKRLSVSLHVKRIDAVKPLEDVRAQVIEILAEHLREDMPCLSMPLSK